MKRTMPLIRSMVKMMAGMEPLRLKLETKSTSVKKEMHAKRSKTMEKGFTKALRKR